jgi:hypothetical protein
MKYLLVVFLWTGYVALHSYLISTRFTYLTGQAFKGILCLLQAVLCYHFIGFDYSFNKFCKSI